MIKNFKEFNEATSYHTLNDGDEYDITKTVADDGHDYEYCDGILYELSGNDTMVSVDLIEYTEENLFYPDQIKRYIQYFNEGGITQTFPVQSNPLGLCNNLEEMLEYLDENENFEIAWEILSKEYMKLFDLSKFDIISSPWEFGFNDEMELSDVRDVDDLDIVYNKDIMDDEDREGDYDHDLYMGFKEILEYWKDNKEYTLTDFNHRFAALVEMGKGQVLVEEV